jgi:hypothetical protein
MLAMVGIRDTLGHPRHEQFYDYWRAKSPGPGLLPGRQHIDPIDIPLLMPWIFLIDVVRDGDKLRYRHRLVGTQIAEWMGYDTTGKFLEEFHDEAYLSWLLPSFDGVVESGEPHFHAPDIGMPFGSELEQLRYSRLLCPFAADGKSVDMLAASFVFYDKYGEELPPGGV